PQSPPTSPPQSPPTSPPRSPPNFPLGSPPNSPRKFLPNSTRDMPTENQRDTSPRISDSDEEYPTEDISTDFPSRTTRNYFESSEDIHSRDASSCYNYFGVDNSNNVEASVETVDNTLSTINRKTPVPLWRPWDSSERTLIETSVITLHRPWDSPSTIVGNNQTSHVEPIEPCSSPSINISSNLPCSSKMNREIGTAPQILSFSKKRQISERRSLVPMYDSSSSDSEDLDTAGEMIILEEEILPRILTGSSEIVGETDVVEAILLPQDKPDKISQRRFTFGPSEIERESIFPSLPATTSSRKARKRQQSEHMTSDENLAKLSLKEAAKKNKTSSSDSDDWRQTRSATTAAKLALRSGKLI
ncbi:unnamed protein product, partial [Allacma fusca]